MTRRVVDYKVVRDNSESHLERSVMRYLGTGWELQGGVSMAGVGSYGSTKFAQAMVKYEVEEKRVDNK